MRLAKCLLKSALATVFTAIAIAACDRAPATPNPQGASPVSQRKSESVAAETPATPAQPTPSTPASATTVPVTFTGGYETVGEDRGRPVILIAAALNVPPETFRKAFSNVHPAPGGREPEPAQVQANKKVLMDALEPLGITDGRLNEVSNFYRYQRGRGELWKHTPAATTATIQDGKVTGFTITSAGAGYNSPPEISVPGYPNATATVSLSFGTDLKTNGSIKEIKLTSK